MIEIGFHEACSHFGIVSRIRMFVHDAGPQALVQYSHLFNYAEARNDLENTAFLFNGRRYAFEVQFSKLRELVIHKASNYSRDFELQPMKPEPVHISERIPSNSDRFSGYPSRDSRVRGVPLRSSAPKPACSSQTFPQRLGASAQPSTPSDPFYAMSPFSAGSQAVPNSNGNKSRASSAGPNPRMSSGMGSRDGSIDGSSFLQRTPTRSEGRLVHYSSLSPSYDPFPQSHDPFSQSYDPYLQPHDPYPQPHDPISESHDSISHSYTSISQSHDPFSPTSSQSFDLSPPSISLPLTSASQALPDSRCPPFYPDVPLSKPSFQTTSSIALSTPEPSSLSNSQPFSNSQPLSNFQASRNPLWSQNDFVWSAWLPSRPIPGLRLWVIEGFAQEVPLSELVDFLYGIYIVYAEFTRQRMGYVVAVFGVSDWTDAIIAEYLSHHPVNGRVVRLQGSSRAVNV